MSTTFSEAISRAPLKAFSVTTFVICMLVLIADGMDAQLLGIVAPLVIADFATNPGAFGLAMGAALVGFGVGSWGGGWLGDTLGRRWSLVIATVIFAFATIGASLAEGVGSMALWRLVGGLGFGSAYANAITLAGEWLPDRWRSVGVTTLSVGTPAGGFVVAALAPTLVEAYGWRGSFVAVGAGSLLVVVLILAFLRDSPSFLLARGKTEEARAAARQVLDGEVELLPEQHYSDRGGVAIGVFDASNSRFNLGIGIAFAASTMVAYALLSWTTTMLSGDGKTTFGKGFAFADAAYAVSVGGLTSIAGSIAVGLLVQKFGSRIVMRVVAIGLLATLLALAAKLEGITGAPTPGDVNAVIALVGATALFFSASIATLYALMTHGYPSSCRSAGIGFGIFVGRVGAVAATTGGGAVIGLGQGSVVPFFAVLCVSAVLIFLAASVVDRQSASPIAP